MTETRTEEILVDTHGPVAIITINRPHRLNAVTPNVADALRAAFLAAEAEPEVRAVVITGAGRGFCAGADISGDVGNAKDVLIDHWNPLVSTMRDLELPIIGAINGVAAGAGVSLALACDLRVATQAARFQLSFTKIGLVPDAGATWLLPRIVGLGRANELAMLAGDLAAPEAFQWGLVNRLCDNGSAFDTAVALGHEIANLASSVSEVKRAHQRAFDATFGDQLAAEADVQGWLQEQPDFRESTKAFSEKRSPQRFARQTRRDR